MIGGTAMITSIFKHFLGFSLKLWKFIIKMNVKLIPALNPKSVQWPVTKRSKDQIRSIYIYIYNQFTHFIVLFCQ